jgi:hypothetical protein
VYKIIHLYHNRIERSCIEVGLTVEEENEWDSNDAKYDVDALSNSSKESEEHDLDDVSFYSEDKDYDVDNISLSFNELKQRHMEQALQQCQDRNDPLAKAMIDMIENHPPPFELSDNDETTGNILIGKKGKAQITVSARAIGEKL